MADTRLQATFDRLSSAIEALRSGEQCTRFMALARRFHHYSPTNQLLLAAQGADGLVASYKRWATIPSVDGGTCQVRRGERALRVIAPIMIAGDDTTSDERLKGFRAVPVFHQGQLVAPPNLGAPIPQRLRGADVPQRVWDAMVAELNDAGFGVERRRPRRHESPFGETDFKHRTVVVRADVDPAQALKTLVHERAHVLLHDPSIDQRSLSRAVREVEAETVAYLVLVAVGVDSGTYTVPYVTGWASGNVELVRATAERCLASARSVIDALSARLGVELSPDPLAPSTQRVAIPTRTADAIIAAHLSNGPLDWSELIADLPGAEGARAEPSEHPTIQARQLAEAGGSPIAVRAVLEARGLNGDAIDAALASIGPDYLGEQPAVFSPSEIERRRASHPSQARREHAAALIDSWAAVPTQPTPAAVTPEALVDQWRTIELSPQHVVRLGGLCR